MDEEIMAARRVITTYGHIGPVCGLWEGLDKAEEEYLVTVLNVYREIAKFVTGDGNVDELEKAYAEMGDTETEFIQWLHDKPNKWEE